MTVSAPPATSLAPRSLLTPQPEEEEREAEEEKRRPRSAVTGWPKTRVEGMVVFLLIFVPDKYFYFAVHVGVSLLVSLSSCVSPTVSLLASV